MKILITIVLLSGIIFAQEKSTAEKIVDLQLDAYNSRNITDFANTYHDSVEVYMFPNKLMYKGKDILIKEYSRMFDSLKKLHAKSLKRIVLKNKVVDHEEASFYQKKIKKPDDVMYVVVVYEIEDNLIKRVLFCP